MCAGPELILAGTVLSGGASLIGGIQTNNLDNAKARDVLLQGAYEYQKSLVQAKEIRKSGKAAEGSAKADLAKSGVDLTSPTAKMIDNKISSNTEQDAMQAILQGENAMQSAQREADLLKKSGRAALITSVLGAGATAAKGWKSYASA